MLCPLQHRQLVVEATNRAQAGEGSLLILSELRKSSDSNVVELAYEIRRGAIPWL